MNIRQIFRAGWMHGKRYRRHQSVREVMTEHPIFRWEDAVVFLNGQDDGIRDDRFRLDYDQREGSPKHVA